MRDGDVGEGQMLEKIETEGLNKLLSIQTQIEERQWAKRETMLGRTGHREVMLSRVGGRGKRVMSADLQP